MARVLQNKHKKFLHERFGISEIDELGDEEFKDLFNRVFEVEAFEDGNPSKLAAYIVDYMLDQMDDEPGSGIDLE